MATVKVKFRPSTVGGRPGSIVYFVTHRRATRQITTKHKVFPCEWDERHAKLVAPPGSERGETVYHGTGSGEFPIAVFVPENVGYAHRVIDLSVKFADSDGTAQTLSLTQLAPSWYGNDIGCERIESSPAPWGFYWESDFQIICDVTGCSDDDRTGLRQYIEWTQSLHDMSSWPIIGWIIQSIYGDDIPDLSSFVDMDKSGDFWASAERLTR